IWTARRLRGDPAYTSPRAIFTLPLAGRDQTVVAARRSGPTRAHLLMPAEIRDRQRIAVERIEPIALIAQRLEAHVARVQHQTLADQALAEADDLADRFQRHHRAHHARERAEHAGLLAGRHRARRRRLREKTTISRVELAVGVLLMRADRGQRAVEGAQRSR